MRVIKPFGKRLYNRGSQNCSALFLTFFNPCKWIDLKKICRLLSFIQWTLCFLPKWENTLAQCIMGRKSVMKLIVKSTKQKGEHYSKHGPRKILIFGIGQLLSHTHTHTLKHTITEGDSSHWNLDIVAPKETKCFFCPAETLFHLYPWHRHTHAHAHSH